MILRAVLSVKQVPVRPPVALRSKVMKKIPWFSRVGLGVRFISALRKICNRREYKATVDETKVHDTLSCL